MPKAINTTHIRPKGLDWITYEAGDEVPLHHVPYFKAKGAEILVTPSGVVSSDDGELSPNIEWTYDKLKALNAKEQKAMLKQLGIPKKEMPGLEADRISKILELQGADE